jgi:xanthine/uracil permease
MSVHRAGQLTLLGSSVLYAGVMGMLVAVNAPAVSSFWKPIVIALGAIALAGLVTMLVGMLIRVDEHDRA